jgi:Predicted membrane protein (DUF2142)
VRRWWLLSLVAFFLMGTAWALALPVNGTYDEKDHIVFAYAVAHGRLTTERTITDRRDDTKPAFVVPASLLPDFLNVDCPWAPRPYKTADCQKWRAERTSVPMPTGAARYSPVYYLPVGIPLALWPDRTGILLARLVSALLSALLLASAVVAALRLGSRLLVVAVALTATPMAVNLYGSVNPNGLEIAAGVLVFCTLLALVRTEHDDATTRRLLVLAGLGSVLLLTVRQLGPALLALVVVTCLLLARRDRLAALWRRRSARWILGGCWLAGTAFAVGWVWYSGLDDVTPVTRDARHLSGGQLLSQLVTWRLPFYLKQVVGQFGYGETTISLYALVAWYLLGAVLVLPGVLMAGWRARWALLGLAAASLGLLVALEVYFLPRVGWFAHGRYAMPAAVGIVLGAAVAGREDGVRREDGRGFEGGGGFEEWLNARGWLTRYALVLTAATAPLHLYALARVMTRYQVGIAAPLNPFGGVWRPPVGSLVPLLVDLAGVLLLVLVAAARWPAAAASEVASTGTRQATRWPTSVGRSSHPHR